MVSYGEKKKWFQPENLRLLALEHDLERSLQQFKHLEQIQTHKTRGQKSGGLEDQNHDIKNDICVYIAMVTNAYPRAKN